MLRLLASAIRPSLNQLRQPWATCISAAEDTLEKAEGEDEAGVPIIRQNTVVEEVGEVGEVVVVVAAVVVVMVVVVATATMEEQDMAAMEIIRVHRDKEHLQIWNVCFKGSIIPATGHTNNY